MKKIAIFWEKMFRNNNFYNLDIDKNLSPILEFAKNNGLWNTISSDLLDKKNDNQDYIILCFLTFWLFTITEYIRLFKSYPKNKRYLFLFEPRVVAPLSYSKIVHQFFDRVYTWNDDLVDNKKYFKFIWPQSENGIQDKKEFENKKFITLINWNKCSFLKKELYSERETAIRFFEKDDVQFDLYWTNWEKKNIKQRLFWYKTYPSYRWKVQDKIETLSNYKFNLCFENMKDTPWYITEKIWDSFKAKSVPIYWGASNISDYIPEDCFIDFRNFEWNYEKLVVFLKSIDEKIYDMYISRIELFMETREAKARFDKERAKNFINKL